MYLYLYDQNAMNIRVGVIILNVGKQLIRKDREDLWRITMHLIHCVLRTLFTRSPVATLLLQPDWSDDLNTVGVISSCVLSVPSPHGAMPHCIAGQIPSPSSSHSCHP